MPTDPYEGLGVSNDPYAGLGVAVADDPHAGLGVEPQPAEAATPSSRAPEVVRSLARGIGRLTQLPDVAKIVERQVLPGDTLAQLQQQIADIDAHQGPVEQRAQAEAERNRQIILKDIDKEPPEVQAALIKLADERAAEVADNRRKEARAYLESAAQFEQAQLAPALQHLATSQQAINAIPEAKSVQDFNASQGLGGHLKEFAPSLQDPFRPAKLAINLAAESLPASLPGMAVGTVAGSTAGPAGTAAGAFAGSAAPEFAAKIVDEMVAGGVDITDPKQIEAWIATPGKLDVAVRKATAKGGVIASVDALSGGLAGKLIASQMSRGAGRIAAAIGGEALAQTALEGTGEALGELAGGEQLSPGDILAEMIGGLPANIQETVTNINHARAQRSTATIAQAEVVSTSLAEAERITTLDGMVELQSKLGEAAQAGDAAKAQADLAENVASQSLQQNLAQQERRLAVATEREAAIGRIAQEMESTVNEGVASLLPAEADVQSSLPSTATAVTPLPNGQEVQVQGQGQAPMLDLSQAGNPSAGIPETTNTNRGIVETNVSDSGEPASVAGQGSAAPAVVDPYAGLGAEPLATAPATQVSQGEQTNASIVQGANALPLEPSPVSGAGVRGQNVQEGLQETAGARPQEEAAQAPVAPSDTTFIGRSAIGKYADRVLKERGPGSGALNTIDPQLVFAYAVKGAQLIEQGVRDIAQWTAEMTRQFGEMSTRQLAEIRHRAERLLARTQAGEDVSPEAEIADIASQQESSPSAQAASVPQESISSERVPLDDEDAIERAAAEQGGVDPPEVGAVEEPSGNVEELAKETERAFGKDAADRVRREQARTQVLGEEVGVEGRQSIGPETFATMRADAQGIFDAAGVPVEWNGQYFVPTNPEAITEEQAVALLDAAKKYFENPNNKPQVLANSLRSPDSSVIDLPNVSKGIRLELWRVAQSEASFYGMMLRAFKASRTLSWMSRNIDVVLHKQWGDAFGGEFVAKATSKIKQAIGTEASAQVADRMSKTPRGKKAVDAVEAELAKVDREASGKPRAPRKRGEGLRPLIDAILGATPEQQSDPRWRTRTVYDFFIKRGLTPTQAQQATQEFITNLDALWKQVREKAVKQVERSLTPKEKRALNTGKKPLWRRIAEMVNSGVYDSETILAKIASAHGWNVPTPAERQRMIDLSVREQRLRTLTEEERAKFAGDQAAIDRAERLKAAATENERHNLRNEMNVLWSKFTRPLTFKTEQGRANLLQAGQEHLSANMLLTLGFWTKQPIDVFTQLFYHTPFAAIAQAKMLKAADIAAGRPTSFWADASDALGDAGRNLADNLRNAVTAGGQAFVGHGKLRNVEGLLTSIQLFDRIRDNARQMRKRADAMPEGFAKQRLQTRAFITQLYGYLDVSMRAARALDAIQGTFIEAQEEREQRIAFLRDLGLTREQARAKLREIEGDRVAETALAMAQTKAQLEQNGIKHTPAQLRAAAYNLFRQRQQERARANDLPVEDIARRAEIVRQTHGWNMPEKHGIGAGVAKGITAVGKAVEKTLHFPLPISRFENAIAIGINRAATFAGGGFFPSRFGKINDQSISENYWFRTPKDRAERKLEASFGLAAGGMLAALAGAGLLRVYNRGPDDPEDRDLWYRQGHRPGTAEFRIPGSDKAIPISTSSGPFAMLRIPLSVIGTIQDVVDTNTKRQAKMDAEAAGKGVKAQQVPALSAADLGAIAAYGAFNALTGGRTAGGAVGSVIPTTQAGFTDILKNVAVGQTSPFVPGLPGFQQAQRARGVAPDRRVADFASMMVPLENDPETKVNFLNDRITDRNVQLFVQTMTGGTFPGVVDYAPDSDVKPYRILARFPWRPSPISKTEGRIIDGELRDLTNEEWIKAMKIRGSYLKAALNSLDERMDDATLQQLAQMANKEATRYALEHALGATAASYEDIERMNQAVDASVTQ